MFALALKPRMPVVLLSLLLVPVIAVLAVLYPHIVFIVAACVGFHFFIFTRKQKHLPFFLLVGFYLRMLLIIYHTGIGPLFGSDSDAKMFDQFGWDIAESWTLHYIAPLQPTGSFLYAFWLAIWYFLFGHYEFIPLMINVMIGVLSAWAMYLVSMEITKSEKVSFCTSIIMLFMPTMVLNSALNIRDMFIMLFTILSFYCFTKWIKAHQFKMFVLAMALIILPTLLHTGMISFACVYTLFYCMYYPERGTWSLFRPKVVVGLGMAIAFYFFFFARYSNGLPTDLSVDFINKYGESTDTSRAAYLVGYDPSSVTDLILQTPIRMFYFLFTPLPWMVSGITDVFGFLDMLLHVFLVLFALKGLKKLKKENAPMFWAIVLTLIVSIAFFSWGVHNYGTAIRHRMKIAWLLMPVSMLGLSYSKWKYFFKSFIKFKLEGKV